jgi:hypothetical protein
MSQQKSEPLTFVERVLQLLEERFPWLGSPDEQVSGADTIQELSELHQTLVRHRDSEKQNRDKQ